MVKLNGESKARQYQKSPFLPEMLEASGHHAFP
jgi:hypothetical protein